MSVFRVKHDVNYVVIHKLALEEKNLSFKAKGLWAYCMSRPDDWQFHISHLKTVSREGEDAIYSAIKELIECGYCEKIQTNQGKGEGGGRGTYLPVEYIIHEKPIQKNLKNREKQLPKDQYAINPALLSIEEEPKNEREKESLLSPLSGETTKAIKSKKDYPEEAKEAAASLLSERSKLFPSHKPPKLDDWHSDLDKLNRIDKRSWEEIRDMISWAYQDKFWCKQILSPDALRRHWDKMAARRAEVINPGSTLSLNREIAMKIKDVLRRGDEDHLLRIYDNEVYNVNNNESIKFTLPTNTFEEILMKWYGITK